MTKKKYRFKGHESFILREGWVNKGLREIDKDPLVFFHNSGAEVLGVGANMAKAIRYWMRCAGLSEEQKKKGVRLSKLGKKIWEYDAYLEDVFSYWMLHCNIVKNLEQATAWNLFFNYFDKTEFGKEEMVQEIIFQTEKLDGIEKFSEKSVENDCEAILRMYIKRSERGIDPEEKNVSPFGIFELIKQNKNSYYKNQPNLNLLPAEIVLYLLTDCMSKENSVSIDDLLTVPGSPGCILNLKRTGLMEKLEELEKKEYLQMNRTAGLDMVYLQKILTREEIVDDYFQLKDKGKLGNEK